MKAPAVSQLPSSTTRIAGAVLVALIACARAVHRATTAANPARAYLAGVAS